MRKFSLNNWEVLLVVFGAILFMTSAVILVTDYPLRKYFFDFNDSENQPKIGHLAKNQGPPKRQQIGGSEFNGLKLGEDLFALDVVVAGPGTTARLRFEDDSTTVDLAENTMVRLAFHKEITFGGVRRLGELNVVSGNVTARTHKSKFLIRSQGKVFTVAPNTQQGLNVREVNGKMVTELTPPVALKEDRVDTDDEDFVVPVATPSPEPSPAPSPTPPPPPPKPVVKPVLKSVRPLEFKSALVSGNPSTSNKIRNEVVTDFNIEIRWENYPGAKYYKIWFASKPDSPRPLLEKTLTKNSYFFNKGKLFVGQFYYRVFAYLASGQVAVSETRKFAFEFLPPILTSPVDRSMISRKSLEKADERLFLSWQKTNFTEKYELEVYRDPQLRSLVLKKLLLQNYWVFDQLKQGEYWWRVRSRAKDLSSAYSQLHRFKIVN